MSAEYYYRRKLGAKDYLPAAGVGLAAGLAAFYLVQLLIQRTPLVTQGELHSTRPEPLKRTVGGDEEPETVIHEARELPAGKPPAARLVRGSSPPASRQITG